MHGCRAGGGLGREKVCVPIKGGGVAPFMKIELGGSCCDETSDGRAEGAVSQSARDGGIGRPVFNYGMLCKEAHRRGGSQGVEEATKAGRQGTGE